MRFYPSFVTVIMVVLLLSTHSYVYQFCLSLLLEGRCDGGYIFVKTSSLAFLCKLIPVILFYSFIVSAAKNKLLIALVSF